MTARVVFCAELFTISWGVCANLWAHLCACNLVRLQLGGESG
jgi:hypothetical protein